MSLQTLYRLNNSPDTGRLEGRTILITGAASGIGRCCALSCAGQGAMVLILDRNESALNTVYGENSEKLPTAEEISDAYVFLLSAESSDIRDCKLEINDGVLTSASTPSH